MESTTSFLQTNENYSLSVNKKNQSIKYILKDYKLVSDKLDLIIQKLSKNNLSSNS
jgi:hypothetical protein